MYIKYTLLIACLLFSLCGFSAEQSLSLNGHWQFTLDPQTKGESKDWFNAEFDRSTWRTVTVPHTWNVDAGSEDYMGTAWYSTDITLDASWQQGHTLLEFDAIYQNSKIWLNGKLVKVHNNSGWTPFDIAINNVLLLEGKNNITVQVDNSPSLAAIPLGKSFDWAADGGIIRGVRLRNLPQSYIDNIHVNSALSDDFSSAQVSVKGYLSLDDKVVVEASIYGPNGKLIKTVQQKQTKHSLTPTTRKNALSTSLSALPTTDIIFDIDTPELWHFDFPNLYTVKLRLLDGKTIIHQKETSFGIRKINIKDGVYVLNGEPMRLMGVEWMPGSDPRYGMAESPEHMRSVLRDLKALNSVITRFHWQQDRSVFEFMDREGMLVQEEIPAWGKDLHLPNEHTAAAQKQQSEAMINAHYNHPSIYAWGVGNEMGHFKVIEDHVQYGHDLVKQLDPSRLSVFVNNDLHEVDDAKKAATAPNRLTDFIEWNDYYESWYRNIAADGSKVNTTLDEVKPALQRFAQYYPDKSVVISEYGYCQCNPRFEEGDERRIEMLKQHTELYRTSPNVAGAIFFSYNDYRTHMGDKGQGAFKQRVHGVVDLQGKHKPSWEVLRKESSPIKSLTVSKPAKTGETMSTTIALTSRSLKNDMPAYTLNQYLLTWITYDKNGLPLKTGKKILPSVVPGSNHSHTLEWPVSEDVVKIAVEVFRPTGYSVHNATWQRSAE